MNDLLILASLLSGPLHGYALKNRIGTITGQGPMHNNLVYPLLKRFVAASWVSRRKAPGQRGQTRELYSLTPKGKQALLRRLADFSEKDAASADSFRIRVALFSVLGPEERARILDSRSRWLARSREHDARSMGRRDRAISAQSAGGGRKVARKSAKVGEEASRVIL